MEFSQETYELIEEYLSGSLKGTALQAFQERLATDKALAAEVEFQREMQFFLAETPENKLRKNLEKLNQSVDLPPKKSTSFRQWGLLLLPFGLLAGWWIWSPSRATKQQVKPAKQPVPILLDSSLPVANQSSPTETLDLMIIDEPLAAPPLSSLQAFEPNEIFDQKLKQLQKNYQLEVLDTPSAFDYEIEKVGDSSLVDLNSRFRTTQTFNPTIARLEVWSNTVEALPLFTEIVDVQPSTTDTFQLTFQQKLLLAPGRYYWTLRDTNQTNFFFIHPFFVRLAK